MKSSYERCDIESNIVSFSQALTAGELPSKERFGSKAVGLMRMSAAGLPIPPGFVIGTEVCRSYLQYGRQVIDDLMPALERALQQLSEQTGRQLGDSRRPLLVSVRSGAAVSMPGMMETILNIGLNPITAKGLIRVTGNPRLAADCRRRLVAQYGEVVEAISAESFDKQLSSFLQLCHVNSLDELDTASLNRLADLCEDLFAARCGHSFPSDPMEQLSRAVAAVLLSWSGQRAVSYRRIHSIPDEIGTAVIVQSMVFGNQGPTSGAGVGFTRNPANGSPELYVDYLPNAQGEDVVAGRRIALGMAELQQRAPAAYQSLLAARSMLEHEFQDMQDFEFTVEDGRLFLLQTRSGKRTPLAALQIACDLVAEGLISPPVALARLKEVDLKTIQVTCLATQQDTPLTYGVSAGAGVAVGAAVFDPARIPAHVNSGNSVILIRENADTDDIEALNLAAALVCRQGARTSHAAVVARQLSKPCVVGCQDLVIHSDGRSALIGSQSIAEGSLLSVDGASGAIFRGAVRVIQQRPSHLLDTVASWASA